MKSYDTISPSGTFTPTHADQCAKNPKMHSKVLTPTNEVIWKNTPHYTCLFLVMQTRETVSSHNQIDSPTTWTKFCHPMSLRTARTQLRLWYVMFNYIRSFSRDLARQSLPAFTGVAIWNRIHFQSSAITRPLEATFAQGATKISL